MYMSGKFNKNDSSWIGSTFRQGNFSDADKVAIDATFDLETDYDIKQMVEKEKEIKRVQAVALKKVITFPLDYLTTLFILGSKEAKVEVQVFKLYLKGLRRKLNQKDLKNELQNIYRDAKLNR